MISVNVGERIRQLRLGLGMSVRALAAKTGFSPSLISQAENGQVTPSIGSLERIAMALGVSLGKFFAEPETSTVRLVRASLRPKLTSTWSPVSIEALAPWMRRESWSPSCSPWHQEDVAGYFLRRLGERFALVVEGEASLTLGDEVHALRKADAITFIPAIPYEWINISAGPTQVVIVTERVLP